MNATEVLLHPVRLRIVAALSGGRDLTTKQLCERIDDVSRVTVYRQLALLLENAYIEVAGEERVRGAVERRYRLRPERPRIDADLAAEMTLEDHRRGFAAAMAVLIAEFTAYLDSDGADPVADQVGYRQTVLWLSPAELTALLREMLDVLRGSMANGPAADRRPYVLSPVLFPQDRPPGPPDTDPDTADPGLARAGEAPPEE